MNKDAEAIDQFLAWLTQKINPVMGPSGENSNPAADPELSRTEMQSYLDPLNSELEAMQADLSGSSAIFTEDVSSLELGEIPAVQDRFHAIIKRRLRVEIERNPPLFPWETSLWDYESEQPDWMTADAMPTSFWTAQLQTVKLPVPLPEGLLLQVFAECRKVVHSSLRQGVKLVQVVESFFPDQSPTLNYWAGQVLTEPARSSQTFSPSALPPTYEAANPTQQMVLSLLAARQVLDAMTLEVSAECPYARREWMTAAGELVLEVEYQPEANCLRARGQLPRAGRLTFKGQTNQATASCSEAETLSLELGGLTLGQNFALEVELGAGEPSVLAFAVHLTEDL